MKLFITALLTVLALPATASNDCDYCREVQEKAANMPLFGIAANPAQKAFAKQVSPLFSNTANNLLSVNTHSVESAALGFDQYDQFRLSAVKESAWGALQDIYQHSPNDTGIKGITKLLGSSPQTITAENLVGDWRCRTHKLAGFGNDITSYRYFKCKLSMKDGQLYLQKTSGSQRIHGPAYPVNGGYAVKGCGYYWYSEELCEYGGGKTDYRSRVSEYDEAGMLVFANRNHGALLLPMPFFESKFDILEFKR